MRLLKCGFSHLSKHSGAAHPHRRRHGFVMSAAAQAKGKSVVEIAGDFGDGVLC